MILLSVLCYYLFKAEEEKKKNENEDEGEEEEGEEEEEDQVKILKESELRPERKPSNSNMKPQAC